MLVIRPVELTDLPQLQRLAHDSLVGVTSLPDNAERQGRILWQGRDLLQAARVEAQAEALGLGHFFEHIYAGVRDKRDHIGRVLEVDVDRDEDVAARMVDAGGEGWGPQQHQPGLGGVQRKERVQCGFAQPGQPNDSQARQHGETNDDQPCSPGAPIR